MNLENATIIESSKERLQEVRKRRDEQIANLTNQLPAARKRGMIHAQELRNSIEILRRKADEQIAAIKNKEPIYDDEYVHNEPLSAKDRAGLAEEKRQFGSGPLTSELDPGRRKKREEDYGSRGRVGPKANLDWHDKHDK